MLCPRWNELEFVRFCENQLSQRQLAHFYAHLDQCRDCRERFSLSWDLLTNDDSSPQDDQEVRRILSKHRWQQRQRQLAQQQAENIRVNYSSQSSQPIPELNQQARFNISNLSTLRKTALAAALVLLSTGLPLTAGYFIYQRADKNSEIVRTAQSEIPDSSESEANSLAAAFEAANKRLAVAPDDAEAVFERANNLEKLYLLEAAQADYQRYLTMTGNVRSQEAEQRIALIDAHLNTAPQASKTVYDDLDSQIDQYLDARLKNDHTGAKEAMGKAQRSAERIEQQSGDRFGRDILHYYQNVSAEALQPLQEQRKEMALLETGYNNSSFSENLKRAWQAKSIFLLYDAKCETERIDYYIVRFLSRTGDAKQGLEIIENSIKQAESAHHYLPLAQLLFIKGDSFAGTSNFGAAIDSFEKAINVAENLNTPRLLLNITTGLVYIYYTTNENQQAFNSCYQILQIDSKHKYFSPFQRIQLIQVMGMIAFNLKYSGLAESNLQNGLKLAKRENIQILQVLSHIFSGILHSEEHKFNEAEESFKSSFETIAEIKDPATRSEMEFSATGYYARAQLLSGKTAQAQELYARAISIGEAVNIQDKLPFSQLHQGLAECYLAQGDPVKAEPHLSIAKEFNKLARARSEENNTLLSFAINP